MALPPVRAPLTEMNSLTMSSPMRSGKENQGIFAPSPAKNNKKDLFTSPLKAVPPAEPELLTDENPDRYTMFPIKCQTVWEYYKKAEASFWTGE